MLETPILSIAWLDTSGMKTLFFGKIEFSVTLGQHGNNRRVAPRTVTARSVYRESLVQNEQN